MATKVSIKTTFEPAKTIEPIYTGGDVSLDQSGRLLATCVDEDALIVDIETGGRVFRIEGDGEPITSLALSPSASHLIVCSRSLSMRIYALNGPRPELQRTLKPHTTPVITSAIDPTGTLLATGGADGTIKIWDIRGGFPTHTFHGHGGLISALCFFHATEQIPKHRGMPKMVNSQSPTETPVFFLASGSEDGKIRVWNLQSRKSSASLDSHVSVVKSIAFSEQRQTLLSASRDKTIILWDAKSWKPRKVIPVLEVVEAAGFATNSDYCYSGGENGRMRIWSTSSGREATKEQIAGSENDSIVSIQCGPTSLLSVHLDQTIQIHDLRLLDHLVPGTSIDPLPIMRRISGNHDEIIDIALIGPDRSLLALATNTESIRIISIAESSADVSSSFGADVGLLAGHSEIIICLDVDWSGHWLATGAKDNTARLWRLDPANASYTCFCSFEGHAESLGAVALPRLPPSSPLAAADPLNHPPVFLLTGSQDRTIKRWDTSKLKVTSSLSTQSVSKSLYTRVAHEKDINAIDVSPTSPLFASASQDRTIKVWDLESGSVAGILRGHRRGVWSIRFAPKDTPPISTESGSSSKGLLVSGSGDRTVKLWSLSTYTCILTFEGHSNSVLKVLWLSPPPPPSAHPSHQDEDDHSNPSSRLPPKPHPIIASASSDTLVKLWSPYSSSSNSTTTTTTTTTTISLSDTHLLTTLDNHSDRVWALATPPTSPHPHPYPLISASADATLTLWTDTTTATLHRATQQAQARISQCQDLENHIRSHRYREAISLSLTLNHPRTLLTLFQDLLNSPPTTDGDQTNPTALTALNDALTHLSPPHLYQLLCRLRDWNTHARTAPVAQRILNLVLRSYPIAVFVEMAEGRKGKTGMEMGMNTGMGMKMDAEGTGVGAEAVMGGVGVGGPAAVKQLLRALDVYTERHLRRVEELVDESFLIEYTLGCMEEVVGGEMEMEVEMEV